MTAPSAIERRIAVAQDAIGSLEHDLWLLEGLGAVVSLLGGVSGNVSPDAFAALGDAIETLSFRLKQKWHSANHAARELSA